MLPNTQSSRDWMPTAELTALHATLASVDDTKIPKLLEIVDSVQRRGATDALIAPFRTRMAQLQPARPLRFARLLFLPLNPLIVPPPAWKANAPSIPRGALVPMAEAIHAAMGKHAATIDGMIAGRTTHDHRVIAEAGPMLWTAAASTLPQAATPVHWQDTTGLPLALFTTIAGNTAVAFGQVLTIQTWRAAAETGTAVRTTAMQNLLPCGGPSRRLAAASPSRCVPPWKWRRWTSWNASRRQAVSRPPFWRRIFKMPAWKSFASYG
jgi:hypothetical protein